MPIFKNKNDDGSLTTLDTETIQPYKGNERKMRYGRTQLLLNSGRRTRQELSFLLWLLEPYLLQPNYALIFRAIESDYLIRVRENNNGLLEFEDLSTVDDWYEQAQTQKENLSILAFGG